MADEREVFSPIEDTTGEGLANIGSINATDAPGTDKYGAAFAFLDNAGNKVFPSLTADGSIPISEAAGTPIRDSAAVVAAGLLTDTDVLTVTLTASKLHTFKFATCSSFQPVVWRVEHNNDGTPDELARFVTGSGDFTHDIVPDCIQFTTGGVGTQEIKIIAQQIRGPVSDMHASLCVVEAP
jgi:hypothetical protein